MAEQRVFRALKSQVICREIDAANGRVIYAAPGVRRTVAESLIKAERRLGTEFVTVVLDCNEDTCRLGYGDIEGIKVLESSGVHVRQSPGLRIGILICDDRGWSYSPVALYVEDEPYSDETKNATQLTQEQLEAVAAAICPRIENEQRDEEAEIGVEPLTKDELVRVDANLKVAPPMKFDIMRQVRVFTPYIQYVELRLHGCSITHRTVHISNKIVNRRVSEEIKGRLYTSFNLISKQSELSGKDLQAEIDRIRKKYTKALGKRWKRIMLRNKRDDFDKEVDELRKKVEAHQAHIEANLRDEIDKSKAQIVNAFWQEVVDSPPDELIGQITQQKPDEQTARSWLKDNLDDCFPQAEKLIKKMEVECQFSDVTYETLTDRGFVKALKKAFPYVNWARPLEEFEALRQKDDTK